MAQLKSHWPFGTARFWLLAALLAAASAFAPAMAAEEPYFHLLAGTPSEATDDGAKKDDFLLKGKYFALSYNNSKGTPNWVSWHLTKEDLGKAPRKLFHPDTRLPEGFKRVVTKDYTHSGFNRGHMCPHSDRDQSDESSTATFVMTNIIPQSSENNQKGWNQMELYLRFLVEKKGKELYIVAGPSGKGGTGDNGFKATLAEGAITVPTHTWKVALVLDKGEKLAQVTEGTRVISVIMPNDTSVTDDWAKYRVTLKDVEELTGYKFFDKVDANVLKALREEKDNVPLPRFTVNHDQ